MVDPAEQRGLLLWPPIRRVSRGGRMVRRPAPDLQRDSATGRQVVGEPDLAVSAEPEQRAGEESGHARSGGGWSVKGSQIHARHSGPKGDPPVLVIHREPSS